MTTTRILLVGPKHLTEPFAAALLRLVDDHKIPEARHDRTVPIDKMDAYAVEALQRWQPQPPHHLSVAAAELSNNRPTPHILRVHTKEMNALQEYGTDRKSPSPSPSIISHQSWDQIVLLTSFLEREFSHTKIWERLESQTFLERMASQNDILMQRVSIVVALQRGHHHYESISNSCQQQEDEDDQGIQDISQRPVVNQDGTLASSMSERPTTTATAAFKQPPLQQSLRSRQRFRHYPLRALVPIFCCWHGNSTSLQSATRFVWKRCCLAARDGGAINISSPLILLQQTLTNIQLSPSSSLRKRKKPPCCDG